MRGIITAIISLIIVAAIQTPAEARHHGYYTSVAYWQHRQAVARFYRPRARHYAAPRYLTFRPKSNVTLKSTYARRAGGYDRGIIVAHPAGCPARLFCGCGAAIEAFGRSIRDLWSVASWFRFPRTAPADGMAVIWPGRHVAIIRKYHGNGIATLYDANSGGGLTRIHRVNIAGLPVVNPHPGRKHSKLISWGSTTPL